MKVKLINKKKEIGEMNLDSVPRKDEFVEFEDAIYKVSSVTHSESGVKLKVFSVSSGTKDFAVYWD